MRTAPIATSLLLALLAVLGTACQRPSPGEDGRTTFRHATDGTPTALDPAQAATFYANMVVVNLYDTLYRYQYLARPYQLAPNLAAGMPEISDDGTIYTFRIRPGVRFPDDPAFAGGTGREVTVDDLIYSLKRQFDPDVAARGAWLWSGRIVGLEAWTEAGADYDQPVAGLRAIDDHTLEIRLTAPYPQLPYTLATGFSALVPREAVEHYGPEFGRRPVGSGPYRLVSFDSTRAVLERNPRFDRPPLDLAAEGFNPDAHAGYGLEALDGRRYPFIDRLEIHFIEENAARWSALRSGAIDAGMVPSDQLPAVLESRDPIRFRPEILKRYHGTSGPEAGFVFAGFDMADERIGHHPDPERDAANRALRCAIRDAFDWQARNEAFYYGIGEIFPGVIPPVVPEFDPGLERDSVSGDVADGQRRLKAAGWTPETLPRLTYGLVAGVQQRQMYELLRARLTALGFPPEALDTENFAAFGEFSRAMKTRRLDLMFLGWTLDYPDAQNTLQLFYGPNETPGSNNFNYRNPGFDRLYEQAATLPPGPGRTALYRRMNRIVIDDCAAISGLSRTRVLLWDRDFRALPDREILGGFYMRFVAPATLRAED